MALVSAGRLGIVGTVVGLALLLPTVAGAQNDDPAADPAAPSDASVVEDRDAAADADAPEQTRADHQANAAGPKRSGDRAQARARAGTEAVRRPAHLAVWVKGTKSGKLPVLRNAVAVGRLRPFVPGQKVQLRIMRGGKLVKRRNVNVRRAGGGRYGAFRLVSHRLAKPGKYRVLALKRRKPEQDLARARSKRFGLSFPSLRQGRRGRAVRLFNNLLRARGYHAPKSRRFGSTTARAVLAFRKVNRMSRTTRATSGIFWRLAAGKGAFDLRYPGAGRHVEVDLSRQVMVLASKRRPQHTFHISSGKGNTPSDRGHFTFYRRQPGYNMLGMYYSVYYNGGEATHGYKSVPTYPASHGCIRNPIPDAKFIYRWVDLGMSIYVY